jgi:membrane protein
MAASLSYYTIFSLAPPLILLMAVGGVLLGHQAAQGHIMDNLRLSWGVPERLPFRA